MTTSNRLLFGLLVACGPTPEPREPAPVEQRPEPPRAEAAAVEPPQRAACERLRIAILSVEARVSASGDITAQDSAVGVGITRYLRREAREDRCYELAPGGDRELVDEKLMNNCASESPACMATIGENMHVDHLMYGAVERQGSLYRVELKLIDVRTQIVHGWTRTMTPADADQQAVARAGYEALAHRVR